MTFGGEKRLRRGVTFNSFWNWSKLLTDSHDNGGESNGMRVGFWYPTFDRSRWRGNQFSKPQAPLDQHGICGNAVRQR